MTRIENLTFIGSKIATLDDERMSVIAELLQYWTGRLVCPSLPVDQKARIEDALDRLEGGEGLSAEWVFAKLQARLAAAGAGGMSSSTTQPQAN